MGGPTLEDIDRVIEEFESLIDKKDDEWYKSDTYKNLCVRVNNNDLFAQHESWEWYLKNRRVEQAVLVEWRRKRRMIQPVGELEDIPKYGDVMSLREFIENVKAGGFIDYDGYGNYIQGDKMTEIEIHPSDVKAGCVRKEFDRIIWFNR